MPLGLQGASSVLMRIMNAALPRGLQQAISEPGAAGPASGSPASGVPARVDRSIGPWWFTWTASSATVPRWSSISRTSGRPSAGEALLKGLQLRLRPRGARLLGPPRLDGGRGRGPAQSGCRSGRHLADADVQRRASPLRRAVQLLPVTASSSTATLTLPPC